jgi:hypothetical protein
LLSKIKRNPEVDLALRFVRSPALLPLDLCPTNNLSSLQTMTVSSRSRLSLVAALLCLLLAAAVQAVVEPRTGINFPEKYQGSKLDKLGVRTVGPIKAYAVGQYHETFLLKMYMSIGAEKMSHSIGKALTPRCKDEDLVHDFESLLKKGLPSTGASKGTSLAFGTGGGKLTIAVNDKQVGSISSKPLAKAFAGIYTDANAVCELKPVGEGTVEEGGGGEGKLVTPTNCAAVGAILGYGIGKLFA